MDLKLKRNSFIIIGCLIIGVFLRFWVSRFGYNYDFESYKIVGDLMNQGSNVYANTARYNYGPVFFYIQGLLYRISNLFGGMQESVFRKLIITVLTMVDIGIFIYLLKKYHLKFALFFFLNPISIIITGFHNQFDNIAILIMLIAIEFYNEEKSWNWRDAVFILIFSFSLITKHIFYIFPVWILMRPNLGWKKKMVYFIAPIALFLISFLPYIGNGGLDGIINNVFGYRSSNNFPLIQNFAAQASQISIHNGLTFSSLYFPVSILLICAVGYISRKMAIQEQLMLLTVALVAFSSAIANQYLAIPLVGLAVYSKYTKYLYSIFGLGFLLFNPNGFNLSAHYASRLFILADRFFGLFGYHIFAILLVIVVLKGINLFNKRAAEYI